MKLASEETDTLRTLPFPSPGMSNTFSFKLEDRRGRMHRFSCGIFLVLFSLLSIEMCKYGCIFMSFVALDYSLMPNKVTSSIF